MSEPRAGPTTRPRARDPREELEATLFVEAGAGTGKTSELVARVLALAASGNASLGELAAITFTEAAAADLRERIHDELVEKGRRPPGAVGRESALHELDNASMTTIHGFAERILLEHPLSAGLPLRIRVLDEIQGGADFERRFGAFLDALLDDAGARRSSPASLGDRGHARPAPATGGRDRRRPGTATGSRVRGPALTVERLAAEVDASRAPSATNARPRRADARLPQRRRHARRPARHDRGGPRPRHRTRRLGRSPRMALLDRPVETGQQRPQGDWSGPKSPRCGPRWSPSTEPGGCRRPGCESRCSMRSSGDSGPKPASAAERTPALRRAVLPRPPRVRPRPARRRCRRRAAPSARATATSSSTSSRTPTRYSSRSSGSSDRTRRERRFRESSFSSAIPTRRSTGSAAPSPSCTRPRCASSSRRAPSG